MSELADAAWAEAAVELGLDVAHDRGSTDARARATTADDLEGTLDGRRVRVFRPIEFEWSSATTVEVTLARPLLLGADIAFGREAAGGTPARATVYAGIEERRVEALILRTRAGGELLAKVRASDADVHLDDNTVRLRDDSRQDRRGSVSRLVATALDLARLAEHARVELGLVDAELALLQDLRRVAGQLRIDVDEPRLRAAGSVAGATVEAGLLVSDGYRIAARVALRSPPRGVATSRWLRGRSEVERSFPLRLFVSRAHRTGDRAFDDAFVVERRPGELFDRLSDATRAELVALSRIGDVEATTDGVRVRTHRMDRVVDELFARLLAIEAGLAPRGAESPYR